MLHIVIKTECYKLKRYNILWAGVALMLLSVLLTLFTSIANDGSVWDFAYLTEQVIKNNMTMIFPMCITLIAGYIISREQTQDTLKNILTVPVSFKWLLTGKLIVCGGLFIIFGLICSFFTIVAEFLIGFPGFGVPLAIKAVVQITAVNFLLYLAVLPIIVFTSQLTSGFLVGVILAFVYGYGGLFAARNMTLANLYPITASLGIVDYRSYDEAVHWNILMCICSLILVVGISVMLIFGIKGQELKQINKKSKKVVIKKGW
ncbi:MAG TPA: ABC transporter permease [Epulopiscium sp.]|nr:ABC transporter permease [Candidatus Epulonipiscium sp.]